MASNRIALKSLANLSKSTIRHTLNFSNGKTRHFSAPKMPLSQGQVSYLRIGVTECCFWDQNLQACQQQLLSLIHFAGCFWIFFWWRFARTCFLLRMSRLWSINNQRWPAAKAAMEAIRSTGNRLSSAVGAVGAQWCSQARFISWLFRLQSAPTWHSNLKIRPRAPQIILRRLRA